MMIKILMLMFGMNAMSATNFVSHNNEPRGFWANRDAVSMLTGGLGSMGFVFGCIAAAAADTAGKDMLAIIASVACISCFFALFCVIDYFLDSNGGKWRFVSYSLATIITMVVCFGLIIVYDTKGLLFRILACVCFTIAQYVVFTLLEAVGFINPTNTFLSKIIN